MKMIHFNRRKKTQIYADSIYSAHEKMYYNFVVVFVVFNIFGAPFFAPQ